MKEKAQVSFGLILLLGIIIISIGAIVGKPMYDKFSETKIIVAQRSLDVLTQTAEDLYKLGPGNKKCIRVTIPKGVIETKFLIEEATMKVTDKGEITELVSIMDSKNIILGIIPSNSGDYSICIEQTGEEYALMYPQGATCGSGDGCILLCEIDDPDCIDYDDGGGYGLGNNTEDNPYCGNAIREKGEGCELGIDCFKEGKPWHCDVPNCLCTKNESYKGWGYFKPGKHT